MGNGTPPCENAVCFYSIKRSITVAVLWIVLVGAGAVGGSYGFSWRYGKAIADDCVEKDEFKRLEDFITKTMEAQSKDIRDMRDSTIRQEGVLERLDERENAETTRSLKNDADHEERIRRLERR